MRAVRVDRTIAFDNLRLMTPVNCCRNSTDIVTNLLHEASLATVSRVSSWTLSMLLLE